MLRMDKRANSTFIYPYLLSELFKTKKGKKMKYDDASMVGVD